MVPHLTYLSFRWVSLKKKKSLFAWVLLNFLGLFTDSPLRLVLYECRKDQKNTRQLEARNWMVVEQHQTFNWILRSDLPSSHFLPLFFFLS